MCVCVWVGGEGGHKHMDEHKKIEPFRSSYAYTCVKAVLALAHKLLILMHGLAICLLLYLCVRLQ